MLATTKRTRSMVWKVVPASLAAIVTVTLLVIQKMYYIAASKAIVCDWIKCIQESVAKK